MIFVSYSHQDEAWRKRFETMCKPLSRAESMQFWSDKNIKAGGWEKQILAAMAGAVAAVLLVSDNFLASDFIIEKELPWLMRAHDAQGLMVFWAYLDPCDIRRYPQITRFQALTLGELKPMSMMSPWEWKQTMLRGCEMIDEFLKDLERPVINQAVIGTPYPRVAEIPILARPARRRVEILVYSSDKSWWRQSGVEVGKTTARIHLGNEKTREGERYTIVAMTTEKPLAQQTYLSLPDCRTKSSEFTLVRG